MVTHGAVRDSIGATHGVEIVRPEIPLGTRMRLVGACLQLHAVSLQQPEGDPP
jgi:hypothetical protein